MPRTGMETIRREALVNAAIMEIGRAGTLNVTVSQIAGNAGVSSALAHHYFGSKDKIFLAAMRHIMSGFAGDVARELAKATKPRERVKAIIRASFSIENFNEEIISAWLNFYVKAQNSKDVQRLLRVYQRRLHSNLVHELTPIAGEDAAKISHGLSAMIDGLYIRQALRDAPPNPKESVTMVIDYLDMCLQKRGVH
ncbi:MAG: transcriptional regulator BetI [Hyphomicrobiales bacterium]|nr:MAG: transcriptional regulator BetI [Hyphomicrobiales bacterium]